MYKAFSRPALSLSSINLQCIPSILPLPRMMKKVENTVNTESPVAAEEKTTLVVGSSAADGSKKDSRGSIDRAEVEKEKKLLLVQAWEHNEISRAVNKAQKKLSTVTAWENSQKASTEADLRKTEEQLEKRKAEYGEKMRNKVALIHRRADEKRAVIHANRREDILKAEELAAKYRATGSIPKKFLGCF